MVNVFTEFVKPLFRGQAQECFENARREWQLRKKRGEDPVYWIGRVYGYSIEDDPEKKLPAPVHHAWVTVGDKIADPSPFRYGKGKWSRLPDMPAEDFWLPGTEYRGDYIVDDERLDEPIYYMPTKEEMKREKRSSDGSPLVARARRAAMELKAYLAHDEYRSREDLDEYQVGVAGDITAAEWGESFNVSKGDPGAWGKPMWEEYPWCESWSTVGPATGGWLILGDSKRAYTQVQAELELCCKSEAALEIVAEAEERVEHLKAIESLLKVTGAEIADTLAPCDCEVCQERDSSWPDPTPEMLEDPDFNAVWEAIKTWDISVPEVYGNLYSGATGNHVRRILDALKEVDKLNASEALYAFGAWLTTRDESITMSGHDDAAPVAEVISLFCEENNLSDPRPGWEKNISFPEQIGKRIGMIAGIVAIEKFEMLPLPPDKLLKAREAVARLVKKIGTGTLSFSAFAEKEGSMERREVKPGVRVRCISHASWLLGGGPKVGEEGTIKKELYSDPSRKLVYVDWDAGYSLGVPLKELEVVKNTASRKLATTFTADEIKKVDPNLTDDQAQEVAGLLNDNSGARDGAAEEILEQVNEIMDAYGVEALDVSEYSSGPGGYWMDSIFHYVNMGDTYALTVGYDTINEEFVLASWGDMFEEFENEEAGRQWAEIKEQYLNQSFDLGTECWEIRRDTDLPMPEKDEDLCAGEVEFKVTKIEPRYDEDTGRTLDEPLMFGTYHCKKCGEEYLEETGVTPDDLGI